MSFLSKIVGAKTMFKVTYKGKDTNGELYPTYNDCELWIKEYARKGEDLDDYDIEEVEK